MLRTSSQFGELAKNIAFLPALAAFGFALLVSIPAAAMPHLPVPPESFLNYHAANVEQLSQEVTVDPEVRARLARHFHVTEAQMTTYIQNNLVLRHLHHTNVYRVACVRRDGSEYYIESRLPAGTPVFESRATGQPILKLACGNPMVSALPVTTFPNKPVAAPKLAGTPVLMADADLNTPPVLDAIDGTQEALAIPDGNLALPVVLVSPSIQSLGGSSGLSSIFPALLGAGAAVAIAGSHGNSSSSSNSSPVVPVSQAVPEASTVTTFGLLTLGTALLLITRRKARPANA